MTSHILKLRDEVEAELARLELPTSPENLYEPMHYLLGLGGKRIRPILTLLSAELFGKTWQEAMPQALAVEIFHNFTLVHDDIMDSADVRRGLPTVHKKWDNNIALLSGDGMLIIAYQYLFKADNDHLKDLAMVFNKTALEVCEGQQLDMDYAKLGHVSEDDYLEMIRLKTAVLLGGAMEIGAILTDAPTKQKKALYDFAVSLGLAFQIKDDYLDAFGTAEDFGKKIGGDILEGKRTWLTVRSFEKANADQRKQLEYAFNDLSGQERITAVLKVYEDLGVSVDAEAEIEKYSNAAMLSLSEVQGDASIKNELEQLVAYLMGRTQ
jgi:geranylgeranyl diphosphate synthase type II